MCGCGKKKQVASPAETTATLESQKTQQSWSEARAAEAKSAQNAIANASH